jgi:hypothetical protein
MTFLRKSKKKNLSKNKTFKKKVLIKKQKRENIKIKKFLKIN